jgi:hypothetical protein
VEPSVRASYNLENPSLIDYYSSGTIAYTKSGGASVTGIDIGTTNSTSLCMTPSGGSTCTTVDPAHDAAKTYTEANKTTADDHYTYSPTAAQVAAGNSFCAHIDITYGDGYYDKDGNIDSKSVTSKDSSCPKIINEPYVHVYGADVSAGGGFNTGASENCTNDSGDQGIKTFLNTTSVAGSGTQIGALAIKPIYGFGSALLRGGNPSPPKGLSFSNTNDGSSSPGTDSPALGGNLGGTHCATDYYLATMPPGTTASPNPGTLSFNTTAPADGSIARSATSYVGNLTIGSSLFDDATNVSVYVNGDVTIAGNITYKNASWGAIERIPSFRLIVKGNIYISKDVSQLDGIYVSQPTSGGSGQIYTCTNGSSPYSTTASNFFTDCGQKQLLVNGAFIAKKVNLLRTFGSLRASSGGEHLSIGTSKTCTEGRTTNLGDCAAEIFNYTPEIYLSQPQENATSGPTVGRYDYITSLAPVL